MNTTQQWETGAFLTLLQQSRNFYAAVAVNGPAESRPLAEGYLNSTLELLTACRMAWPTTAPVPADNEALLSLHYFQGHLERAGRPEDTRPTLLRDEACRFTQDALLLLTELWSKGGDPGCRKTIEGLLERQKRALVSILDDREQAGQPPL